MTEPLDDTTTQNANTDLKPSERVLHYFAALQIIIFSTACICLPVFLPHDLLGMLYFSIPGSLLFYWVASHHILISSMKRAATVTKDQAALGISFLGICSFILLIAYYFMPAGATRIFIMDNMGWASVVLGAIVLFVMLEDLNDSLITIDNPYSAQSANGEDIFLKRIVPACGCIIAIIMFASVAFGMFVLYSIRSREKEKFAACMSQVYYFQTNLEEGLYNGISYQETLKQIEMELSRLGRDKKGPCASLSLNLIDNKKYEIIALPALSRHSKPCELCITEQTVWSDLTYADYIRSCRGHRQGKCDH